VAKEYVIAKIAWAASDEKDAKGRRHYEKGGVKPAGYSIHLLTRTRFEELKARGENITEAL